MNQRWAGCFALLLMAIGATSCTQKHAFSYSQYYGYSFNYTDTSLTAFLLNPATGALSEIATYYLGTNSGNAVGGPSGKTLYVQNPASISGFAIDRATGSLSNLPGSPYAFAGTAMATLSMDANGAHIYLPTSNGIVVYSVGSDGSLAQLTGSPFSLGLTGTIQGASAVSPAGTTLYMMTHTPDHLYGISIDSQGALSSPVVYAVGNNPTGVTIDPTGQVLYVANAGTGAAGTASVSQFTLNNATGVLTANGSLVTVANEVDTLAIDPSSKYLYGISPTDKTVSAYSINLATAALTAIGAPVAGVGEPYFPIVDPTGQFLYVGTGMGSSFSAFAINATSGALTPLSGSFSGGSTPYSLYFVKVSE